MTSPSFSGILSRLAHVARQETAAVAALLVLAIGAASFVAVADEVTEADGQAFDQAALHWLQPAPGDPRGPHWLEEAASDITSLGGISVLTLFGLIALVFLLTHGKRLSALLLTIGLAGGVALSEGLKAMFERARPPADYQVVDTLNASFPSGHTLLATVFYLSLGVMLTRAFPRQRMKAFILGAAVLIALLVGLTRMYLGAHWASDVLGGWSIGAAWAMALWLIAWAVGRFQRRHAAGLHDDDDHDDDDDQDD